MDRQDKCWQDSLNVRPDHSRADSFIDGLDDGKKETSQEWARDSRVLTGYGWEGDGGSGDFCIAFRAAIPQSVSGVISIRK